MHYCSGQNLTGVGLVRYVKACKQALEDAGITPSCIVMRGISGMSVGMALVADLGCNYAVVRKESDESNSYREIEGDIPGTGQVVIVDDFVATGDTLLDMVNALHDSGSVVLGTQWNQHRDITVLLYQQENVPNLKGRSHEAKLSRVNYLPCCRDGQAFS